MKSLFLILVGCVIFFFSHAQSFETTTDRTGKKMLRGFVTDSILLADTTTFCWFTEQEKVYQPADNIVKSFVNKKDSVSFLVFFGTWCPDSHYVIPRFYNIIEKAAVNKNHITLFALDRTKKDAAHFAENLNVLHVPTIIILHNGKEAGRVVEYGPTGRFDESLAAILDHL